MNNDEWFDEAETLDSLISQKGFQVNLYIFTQTGTIHQCNFGAEAMKSGRSKLKFCINIVIVIEIESVLFCNN